MKPRRTLLSDPIEIAELSKVRWQEGVPLIWRIGSWVYAESDVLKTWREQRAKDGKRS